MEVHFFECTAVGGGAEELFRFKASINHWLATEGKNIEIKHLGQNMTERGGALVFWVSVFFERKSPKDSLAREAEAVMHKEVAAVF